MKFLNLLIIFVLFPNIELSASSHSSSSSSCENLQNIIHNLPGNCRGKNYQLDCEGTDPIISIHSAKFLVKDISFQNTTFRLISPYDSAPGDPSCSLPNQIFSLDSIYDFLGIYTFNYTVIQFQNCTEEIENSEYELIPCLNRANSRVYAKTLSDTFHFYVSQLHDSCRWVGSGLAHIPFVHVDNATRQVNYAALIMQAIETGLLVNWTDLQYGILDSPCSHLTAIFEECWRSSVQVFKYENYGYKILDLITWAPDMATCLFNFQYSKNRGIILTSDLFDLVPFIILARIILPPLAIYSFLLHKRRKITSTISSIEKFMRKNEILCIRRYDFIEISIMTNHFKDKIGQGGFGSVYKGKLLSGQLVAVKILSTLSSDGDDFISEIATIGRIHHANIVRLIGFCSEGSKRALIYAYMPNGSLDKYIFSSSIISLPIEKRREIAIGIARGIDYLHRGCELQILHFDIKPHNILLDNNFTPKISDFGLARLYPKDYNLVALSMIRGTIGYIAPELISRTFGAISYKADIYSFGMLLMEMVSGRRNVNNYAESSSQVYYPSWIYDQLNLPKDEHNLIQDVGKLGEIEETLYKVALWCIQMKPSNRPTMSRVIEMLQSDADNLEMPPRPFIAISPQEYHVRHSEIESCDTELSIISEESSML